MRVFLFIMAGLFFSTPGVATGAKAVSIMEPMKLSSPLWLAQSNEYGEDLEDEAIDSQDQADGDTAGSATDVKKTSKAKEDLLTSKQKRKLKGFWAKYFALKMNKNLSKEVDDKLWAFFVGAGCFGCFGGPVWLPMLIIDEPAPKDYLEDGLINWGLHFLVQRALDAPVVLFALVTSIPLINPLTCADALWWMPVNAINIWDDARKNERARALMQEDWATRLAAQTPTESQMAY